MNLSARCLIQSNLDLFLEDYICNVNETNRLMHSMSLTCLDSPTTVPTSTLVDLRPDDTVDYFADPIPVNRSTPTTRSIDDLLATTLNDNLVTPTTPHNIRNPNRFKIFGKL